ncbi:MAG: efflux RND transporter periplasmic adaptor subunit [Rhodoferax sp.]|uniref:efflux RND transporter periplasmic adaptor subunit n=1 Tax=Rhodoferax sp. TaxID=50421 RepID=UPI00182DA3A1|nr:efflux RND transporter periplasmic adaptor subunit [Rhodoferax sp.]NMM12818.1 efflux RND transporter periplasmic adaptor subunit [Rhodoferax sp.]
MKQGTGIAIGVIAVAVLAAGGGYWLGNKVAVPPTSAGTAGTASAAHAAGDTGKKEPKLLYYRNPMGLPDTSPTPKKDPMGMDYIAVYAGEQDEDPIAANQIKISTEKVQKLGVRTETAQLRTLDRTVRAAGRIEPDERRLFTISPKFEGYVERLYVNVTGQPVGKGQPLFEVYSPELVSAQREYAIAAQGVESLKESGAQTQAGMKQLAESSLQRLKNWDISPEQVKALATSGEAKRTLTFRSPVAGIVIEKKAVQGMRFMPGEALYQVADLSSVWVVADVFEQDIGLVKSGARAKVNINAYPDKVFKGDVTYVYPTLKAETRTVAVRVELANPGLLLKPGMFAQVELSTSAKGKVVTVPVSAVIDSGTRQIVLIQQSEGRFEPREVKLGSRSDNYVEVLDGVRDGEQVVVAANFLIDAESNLKAAVGGFGHSAHGATTKTGNEAEQSPPAVKASGHKAEGTVDSIDMKTGTLSLNHGPVASLKWPAMTMEFKAANTSLLKDLKPGAKIAVEFVERQPGEWVITSVKPLAATPHAGH